MKLPVSSLVSFLSLALCASARPVQDPGVPPPASPGLTRVAQEALPLRDLRGFGPLAGEYAAYTGGAGRCSYLIVRCQDASQASLAHAKFVSDLRVGVTLKQVLIRVDGVDVPALDARDQGFVVAACVGRYVHIVAGAAREGIAALLTASGIATRPDVAFTPVATVPMFLDAWDQHAFRFYYRAWETPAASGWGCGKAYPEQKWQEYNFLNEFDYARQHGDLGFIFWASRQDAGPGFRYDNYWNWAARAAQRRNLPTVINLVINDSEQILNRYREQMMMKMPQFCGGFHSVADALLGGEGVISWCATNAEAASLAQVSRIVRTYAGQTNVIEYMEPHAEANTAGDCDMFLEFGPVADQSFRQFLQAKYGGIDAVSRRWCGRAGQLASWEAVHVPEMASFLGWGTNVVDLTGAWRVGWELPRDTKRHTDNDRQALAETSAVIGAAPAAWYQPGFDDTRWPVLVAPGTDRTMYLEKRPSVYRQTVQVDAAWRRRQGRVWMYVWDLNKNYGEWVDAWLNGRQVGHDQIPHPFSHWAAFDVTDTLQDGANAIALRLPGGYLAYRVYLSSHAPAPYPLMAEGDNARWVDFVDWHSWTRVDKIREGIEMIRRVDPARSILCAAPDTYFSGLRQLCQDYGAHFHNTGYMGVFHAESLPMLMRGVDLPFSLETASSATDLNDFKNKVGLYAIEGVNALHYYIHIGSILWNDDIREEFEKDLPLLMMFGSTHRPKAQAALLLSDRNNNLTTTPWAWRKHPNVDLDTSYFSWRINDYVAEEYPMDAVTDQDFGTAVADGYRVIVDNNTAIMDEALVDRIAAWVRNGGVFVTFVQTGRHLPEKADAWPISCLTGYHVTGIDPCDADGVVQQWRKLVFAPGQDVFDAAQWPANDLTANGLHLVRDAPECRDLMRWEDGSVAIGMRPLGKGFVFHVGAKFCNDRSWSGNHPAAMHRLFSQVLGWAKLARVPGRLEEASAGGIENAVVADNNVYSGLMLRRNVSNNGLYDAWTIWNRDTKNARTAKLVFADGLKPAWCTDVKTGKPLPVSAAGGVSQVESLRLEPREVRMVLTPRQAIEAAPLEWLTLQRNWWRGTTAPRPAPADVKPWDGYVDLTDDWACTPLAEAATNDLVRLATPACDDAAWKRMPLEAWALGEELPTRHAFFRKRFVPPAAWTNGEIRLWIQNWSSGGVHGRLCAWLDGREITPPAPKPNAGLAGEPITAACRPGVSQTLAVDVAGEGQIPGVFGNVWLSYLPAPRARQDLAGTWIPSRDCLRDDPAVALPGPLNALTARRTVRIDAAHAGEAVFLHMESSSGWLGAFVNGHYVRRSRARVGDVTHLNITPWLRFGADNEIELAQMGGAAKGQITQVGLWFYPPDAL